MILVCTFRQAVVKTVYTMQLWVIQT